MKCVLALVLLIGAVSAGVLRRPSLFDKIVGGYIVEKGVHKYQVHLQLTVNFFGFFEQTAWGCGGSIISPKWILTAAHCLHNMDGKALAPSSVVVRTGQYDSSILENHAKNYKVLKVINHERYQDGAQFLNDIALLELEEEIQFNDHTSSIALPRKHYTPADGSELYVSGWGHTTSGGGASQILRAVGVHVVNFDTCNSQYGGAIKAGMMCAAAEGKDSCQGDSGGPLVEVSSSGVQTLVGVVSWGNGCADKDFPGVYSNVGQFVPWIQQITGLTF